MPLVMWDKSFLLGVQQFDEHHQHLVSLLNRAYDDFTAGATSESVDNILHELVDYAAYHFTAEEHWMREQSYPKLDEQCEEHGQFADRITQMLNDQRSDKRVMLLDVMTFLNEWLTHHILQIDSEYGLYIATKGMPINLA
jgi:hemerythrin